MKHLRLLPLVIAPAFIIQSSCSVQSDDYDTPPPYGSPELPADPPADPIYDSPALYEHDTMTRPGGPDPGLPVDPGVSSQSAIPSAQAPSANVVPQAAAVRASVVHTVVKGDTLSGLSSKYRVPMDAIRQANGMTNDTVVLGKRMVIPQP